MEAMEGIEVIEAMESVEVLEPVVTNEISAVYDIHYENATYQAAVCHRCGAKMFPVELLEAHMDRHQLKDMFLESELKKLQYAMNRMR